MNTLPASLRTYRADLVSAIDRELGQVRPTRPRVTHHRPWKSRWGLLLMATSVGVAAILVLTIAAPWRGSPTILERAEAALLAPAAGQILYESVTVHSVPARSPGGLTHVRLWLDSSPPRRFRMTYSGSRVAEIGGTLGTSKGLYYVAADEALYRAAFLVHIRQSDLDPAAFIRAALRSGRARVVGETTIRGRKVMRIEVIMRFNPPVGPRLIPIALYYADADTYRPVRLVIPPPHGRVVIYGGQTANGMAPAFPPGTIAMSLSDFIADSGLGFPMDASVFLVGFPGYAVPDLPFLPMATATGPKPHAVYDFDDYQLLAPTTANRRLTSVQAVHANAIRKAS